MIRLYIALGILLFMSSAAYGAYYYYTDTQERLAAFPQNNAKLETAVASKDLVIDEMKETAIELERLNNELTTDLYEAEAYTDELRKKLQEHDLTLLSLRKSGMIEKRINDGTKDIIGELESITSE
jgi:hypothetical protein